MAPSRRSRLCERERCDSRARDLVKGRDRAPYTKTDPARHLMQFHDAVCEEDQHGAVIRISLPPTAVRHRPAGRHDDIRVGHVDSRSGRDCCGLHSRASRNWSRACNRAERRIASSQPLTRSYAARRKPSSRASQPLMRFQLAKLRLTTPITRGTKFALVMRYWMRVKAWFAQRSPDGCRAPGATSNATTDPPPVNVMRNSC
jgi:hypothetical protein